MFHTENLYLEDLTGRETLRMYCLLRGFPEKDIQKLTKKMALDLNFMQHLDKKVKEYSGMRTKIDISTNFKRLNSRWKQKKTKYSSRLIRRSKRHLSR